MYVVPFSHGPARLAHRPHRRAAHRLALRGGEHADHDPHGPGRPRRARRRRRVRAVRPLGRHAARPTGQADVPWPCDAENKYIVHFPETREIWSTARATAATPCSARSASPCASPRRWPATTAGWPSTCSSSASPRPSGEKKYVAAAFPSACGKTNMAMLIPTLPGWKVETVGDDIAWMKFGDDGRSTPSTPRPASSASPPAPATTTNPNAMKTAAGQLDLHQRRPHRRRRRLVGGHDRRAAGAPHRLEGQRLDARVGHARPPTPTPASPPRPRSARRSPPSGRTRRACRSRPSSSAAAAPPTSRS